MADYELHTKLYQFVSDLSQVKLVIEDFLSIYQGNLIQRLYWVVGLVELLLQFLLKSVGILNDKYV
jgi:hypothetical protein